MARTVFILGAGFNCGAVRPTTDYPAPLATNFMRLIVGRPQFEGELAELNACVEADTLFAEIEREWQLSREDLRRSRFDIEKAFTFFETESRSPDPERAKSAHTSLIVFEHLIARYLHMIIRGGISPAGEAFATHVLQAEADVLTFNYDIIAELAIGHASMGLGASRPYVSRVSTESQSSARIEASFTPWNSNLAYGIEFGNVELPIPGLTQMVPGAEYYDAPGNGLYESCRVFKLHGSLNWLKREDRVGDSSAEQSGLTLRLPGPAFFTRWPSQIAGQPMRPHLITPVLKKEFSVEPFPGLWQAAQLSLTECETLVVVGYSFPPTDIATRAMLKEAFAEQQCQEAHLINPDPEIENVLRDLIGPGLSIRRYDSLSEYYGVSRDF